METDSHSNTSTDNTHVMTERRSKMPREKRNKSANKETRIE